jgi:hypothetical protein
VDIHPVDVKPDDQFAEDCDLYYDTTHYRLVLEIAPDAPRLILTPAGARELAHALTTLSAYLDNRRLFDNGRGGK